MGSVYEEEIWDLIIAGARAHAGINKGVLQIRPYKRKDFGYELQKIYHHQANVNFELAKKCDVETRA